jgi:hypothetical protein
MEIGKEENSKMEEVKKINFMIDVDDREKKESQENEEEGPVIKTESEQCDTDSGKMDAEGQREEQIERERDGQMEEQTEKEREGQREEQTERERDGQREEQTERERDRQREEQRERDGQREERTERERDGQKDDEEGNAEGQKEGQEVDVKANEVIEEDTKGEVESDPTYQDVTSKGDDEDVKTIEEEKLVDSSKTDNEDPEVTSNGFEVIAEDNLNIPFSHYVDHQNLTRGSSEMERFEDEDELTRLLRVYKQSNKDLKDFHRRNSWGTHHTIRGQLWLRVCQTLHKAKGNLYNDYERDLFHQSKYYYMYPI